MIKFKTILNSLFRQINPFLIQLPELKENLCRKGLEIIYSPEIVQKALDLHQKVSFNYVEFVPSPQTTFRQHLLKLGYSSKVIDCYEDIAGSK